MSWKFTERRKSNMEKARDIWVQMGRERRKRPKTKPLGWK